MCCHRTNGSFGGVPASQQRSCHEADEQQEDPSSSDLVVIDEQRRRRIIERLLCEIRGQNNNSNNSLEQVEISLNILINMCSPPVPPPPHKNQSHQADHDDDWACVQQNLTTVLELGGLMTVLELLQRYREEQPQYLHVGILKFLMNATCYCEERLVLPIENQQDDGGIMRNMMIMHSVLNAMRDFPNDVDIQVLGCGTLGNLLEGERRLGRHHDLTDCFLQRYDGLSLLVQASQRFPQHNHWHWSAVRVLAVLVDIVMMTTTSSLDDSASCQQRHHFIVQQSGVRTILEHAMDIFGTNSVVFETSRSIRTHLVGRN